MSESLCLLLLPSCLWTMIRSCKKRIDDIHSPFLVGYNLLHFIKYIITFVANP